MRAGDSPRGETEKETQYDDVTRILAITALAAIKTSSATAQTRNPEVTVYDQPQQQDFFFQMQRQGQADQRF